MNNAKVYNKPIMLKYLMTHKTHNSINSLHDKIRSVHCDTLNQVFMLLEKHRNGCWSRNAIILHCNFQKYIFYCWNFIWTIQKLPRATTALDRNIVPTRCWSGNVSYLCKWCILLQRQTANKKLTLAGWFWGLPLLLHHRWLVCHSPIPGQTPQS